MLMVILSNDVPYFQNASLMMMNVLFILKQLVTLLLVVTLNDKEKVIFKFRNKMGLISE